jgi:4-diphosphocytidyl-2-C-methyl-D-erythritol kinase
MVRAPAKLNLFLSIRGRRRDGYHDLITILQSVSVFDRLRLSIVGPPGQRHYPATRRRMRLALIHDGGPGIPVDEDNLAIQAAQALGRLTNVLDLDVVDEAEARRAREPGSAPVTLIQLQKRIPVAGGMAGGSADAAAALVGLNQLWGCHLSSFNLNKIAMSLGTDVPFCRLGGTALGTGRGTRLARVICKGTYWWVVCQSGKPLLTAEVYAAWDRECTPTQADPRPTVSALEAQDARALAAALHNDLEPAAFSLQPGLADAKARLIDAGALGAVLSGSGPTMLALCESQQAATALAHSVADHFRVVKVACSPAGSPEVTLC